MFAAPMIMNDGEPMSAFGRRMESGLRVDLNSRNPDQLPGEINWQVLSRIAVEPVATLLRPYPLGDAGLEFGRIAQSLEPLVLPNGVPRENNDPVSLLELDVVIYPHYMVFSPFFYQSDPKTRVDDFRQMARIIFDPEYFLRFKYGERIKIFDAVKDKCGLDLQPISTKLYVVSPSQDDTGIKEALFWEGIYTEPPKAEFLEKNYKGNRYSGSPPFVEIFFLPKNETPIHKREYRSPMLSDVVAFVDMAEERGSIICREKQLAVRLCNGINKRPRFLSPPDQGFKAAP